MGYLFFSAEAEAPAGFFIIKILNPIAKRFNVTGDGSLLHSFPPRRFAAGGGWTS